LAWLLNHILKYLVSFVVYNVLHEDKTYGK
jgi:hypothetical protein